MRMISQERAEYALTKVLGYIQGKSKEKQKEFKSLSSSTPSMILQNGFGQTLSFLLAKGKDHHTEIFNIIKEWLIKKEFAAGQTEADFMLSLTGAPSTQRKYLDAQNETLALLEWVKRYASAFCEEDKK